MSLLPRRPPPILRHLFRRLLAQPLGSVDLNASSFILNSYFSSWKWQISRESKKDKISAPHSRRSRRRPPHHLHLQISMPANLSASSAAAECHTPTDESRIAERVLMPSVT